ncbi:MAG: transcriptional regulator [Yangia sp.]|nr:transcriptional regulator [Salipiger sp.]
MDTGKLDPAEGSVLDGLGERIRAMRSQRNMTLQDLSKASRVSVAMLSHIERSRSTPSIKVLDRIRAALNVSFSAFFEETEEMSPASNAAVVTRNNERPLLKFEATGLVKELLSPARGTHMEMMMLNLQPGGYSGEEPWRRVGEKCGIVLEGSFELTIGTQIYNLSEKDAFQFDSSIPHSFRNTFDGMSKIMWIILSEELG